MEFLLQKTLYSVYKKVKTTEALSTNAAILSGCRGHEIILCGQSSNQGLTEMQPSYI